MKYRGLAGGGSLLRRRWEGVFAEVAYAAVGAYDEGEREGVPVLVGVGGVVGAGFERAPVAAVVGGDVGAVGAYGDPGVVVAELGDGGAVAVGGRNGGVPVLTAVRWCMWLCLRTVLAWRNRRRPRRAAHRLRLLWRTRPSECVRADQWRVDCATHCVVALSPHWAKVQLVAEDLGAVRSACSEPNVGCPAILCRAFDRGSGGENTLEWQRQTGVAGGEGTATAAEQLLRCSLISCQFSGRGRFSTVTPSGLLLTRFTIKLPSTGSPKSQPSLAYLKNAMPSQKPSLSGLVKRSFQVWQPSVVL